MLVLQDASWKKIEDLENHIKQVLDISDTQLELYIEDFWIPSSEKIGIICPTDEVVVKESTAASTAKPSSTKKPSNKKTTTNNGSANEEELLAARKQELLSKVVSLEDDEMDVTDFRAESPVKRKRKRKHKKSSRIPLLYGVIPDFNQNPVTETTVTEKREITPLRPGHIRFDHEDMETAVSTSQEKDSQEDWQNNLLSLAQIKDKTDKVFCRQPATNGTNGEAHPLTETSPNHLVGDAPPVNTADISKIIGNGFESGDVPFHIAASIPMESPKTSDLMYFKKLIMKDCIPTVSDLMLAGIEEIGEDNVLTMRIWEGHTDLTFSADELQESEGDSFIVKMEWSKILEPRLVVDKSVLSTYL